ncbi:hypothetical protein CEXT_184041 [Caerostris extrusa]|uniref:DUF3950 domain-containing protein n=1 Tax=Caerostris extrusa TaxID=172846 RepID=A0AAV4VQ09_CAEEX|nr:hypothetical protein CEXT_184041 [Caerostris extrusa]
MIEQINIALEQKRVYINFSAWVVKPAEQDDINVEGHCSLFNFLIRFCEHKKHRELSYSFTAGPADPRARLLFKTNRQMAPKPSPIISSFLELGRRKCRCEPKFVAAMKIVSSMEAQQTFKLKRQNSGVITSTDSGTKSMTKLRRR